MKKLLKSLESEIERFFDMKIKDANVSDDTFNEIWDLVGNLEEDIEELIRDTDKKIDEILDELDAEYNPSFSEELKADQLSREAELYSIDNNYYLTR